MRLVDDDVAQVVEDVRPTVVVRQHADVQHVGVGEDEVRPAADLPATFAGRVAVVDGRADVRRAQLSERPRLVLRERLGRVEVDRALLGVARDRVEHRQVEREGLSRRRPRCGRSDAQVYVLFDVSRSMLARSSAGAPDRLQRAKQLALRLRHGVPDVPFGVVSLTDRVLPHLFPTLDPNVYESVVRDAIGIERPPPSGTQDLATDYSSLGDVGTNNFYGAGAAKRVLVIFSDGESKYFDDALLKKDFDKGNVHVLFVHLWGPDEKIYLGRNNVDPGYRPDPQSNQAVQRIAASGGGEVLGEDPGALVSRTKGFLGTGPQTSIREQRTRVSLGPYVALMALLPLGFVLLRRNV